MIQFKKVLTLNKPFVAAASGLTVYKKHFYIVADDEVSFLKIPIHLKDKGKIFPIFNEKLPTKQKSRKKKKPDFESIIHLPHHDSLLCLPSGSEKNRHRAAIIKQGKVHEVSFKKTYGLLKEEIEELNIEGAIVLDDNIHLFQRGNGESYQNGIITINLNEFILDKTKKFKWKEKNLDSFKGIPLSFTDACIYKKECWFLAVAENSKSTYKDGKFIGAVMGKMNLKFNIHSITEINIPYKPEGLSIINDHAFIVTDADDRTKASCLYTSQIS